VKKGILCDYLGDFEMSSVFFDFLKDFEFPSNGANCISHVHGSIDLRGAGFFYAALVCSNKYPP
jgi:hypothetical protein